MSAKIPQSKTKPKKTIIAKLPDPSPAAQLSVSGPGTESLAANKVSSPLRLFSLIRFVVILFVILFIAKTAATSFLSDQGSPKLPDFKNLETFLPMASQAKASSGTNSGTAVSLPVATIPLAALPVNAMIQGASLVVAGGAESAPLATQAIPLTTEDQDLLKPQKKPPQPTAPSQGSVPLPPSNQAAPSPKSPAPGGPGLSDPALSRREFELTKKETQLNTREQALKDLENDINTRISTQEKSKVELTDLINRNQAILEEQKAFREQQQKEEETNHNARVEHMVAAFKGMKPEQAGALINSMDDDVAVAILSTMPGSNAGKILAMVQPDKAARLVKAISEQKIDPKILLETGSNIPPN